MATWMMHLRVAELVAPYLGSIDETAYYVGCIAPDSGRMVDDFTYLPSKDVSHWKRDEVSYEQRFLDNYAFFEKYGKNEEDKFKKSLFLGYYVHILTDTVYVRDVIHPFIEERGKPFWRANITNIRNGWYELDYRFVSENPNYRPLEIISAVSEFPNVYFDYFTPDDITERILYAAKLYKNPSVNPNQEFLTIDKSRQEELIGQMVEIILNELKKHKII